MNYQGTVLIAHPNLKIDNPFYRTAIYIYQDHVDQGTAGLVLNRPSRSSVKEMVKDQHIIFPENSSMVHQGGPVNTSAITVLHTDDWASTNTVSAGRGLLISSDELMFEKISTGNQPIYWRAFGGMCGWLPGQLESELKGRFPYRPENSWLTMKANTESIYDYDGENQWKHLMEKCSQHMFDKYI